MGVVFLVGQPALLHALPTVPSDCKFIRAWATMHNPQPGSESAIARPSDPETHSWSAGWPAIIAGAALIVLAIGLAYSPGVHGGFIMDDDVYLTSNRLIAAHDGLYRFWFTLEALDYYPVSNTTLWLEWRLWGSDPAPYRISNLILHVASALLLWMILAKLGITVRLFRRAVVRGASAECGGGRLDCPAQRRAGPILLLALGAVVFVRRAIRFRSIACCTSFGAREFGPAPI